MLAAAHGKELTLLLALSELVRAECRPPWSERASSQPDAKEGNLNNTGIVEKRLSISPKDQGGSGHCQAAATQTQDAPKSSDQRVKRLSY